MQFINEQNGYLEEKSTPALWVLLFGGLYFLVSGIWVHFIACSIIGGAVMFAVSPAGPVASFIAAFVVNVVYAFAANSIVRGHFLRKGWKEATEDDVTALIKAKIQEKARAESGAPVEKTCPFCAETIKYEAKICKHCGRDQPELAAPAAT